MEAPKSYTSEYLIEYLVKRGYKLDAEEKFIIRGKIHEATSRAFSEGTQSNGCDCGQVDCPVCNTPKMNHVECGCGQVGCPECGG
jgi:uncharacterized protein (UPF0212 family)